MDHNKPYFVRRCCSCFCTFELLKLKDPTPPAVSVELIDIAKVKRNRIALITVSCVAESMFN